MGSISMFSQIADTSVSGEGPAKLTGLGSIEFRSRQLSRSADRFNEIANLMVSMGLRLQKCDFSYSQQEINTENPYLPYMLHWTRWERSTVGRRRSSF